MPAIRSPSLKVRTPAFQAGNAGFKSRGDIVITTKEFKIEYKTIALNEIGKYLNKM